MSKDNTLREVLQDWKKTPSEHLPSPIRLASIGRSNFRQCVRRKFLRSSLKGRPPWLMIFGLGVFAPKAFAHRLRVCVDMVWRGAELDGRSCRSAPLGTQGPLQADDLHGHQYGLIE